MKNFQEKEKNIYKRVFRSTPFLLLLAFILIFFAYGVFSLIPKMKDTFRNKDLAEKKLNELIDRKEKLEIDIENLNTDKGKEKIFRENFGLVKEGEGVIIIVDDKEVENEEVKKHPFWSKILDWFR
jgi:cell division protein FtsB